MSAKLPRRGLITVAEAAEILGVTTARVHQFIDDGRLAAETHFRLKFLSSSQVRRFAETRSTKPGPVPGKKRAKPA